MIIMIVRAASISGHTAVLEYTTSIRRHGGPDRADGEATVARTVARARRPRRLRPHNGRRLRRRRVVKGGAAGARLHPGVLYSGAQGAGSLPAVGLALSIF